MQYRRIKHPGGVFFFTVNLAERQRRLLVEHVECLRRAMRQVRDVHPFEIDAIVILPDHLHSIWTLPPEDHDYSTRWGLIKAAFSRHIQPSERISKTRRGKGERGIWQRRFWEHWIRDERDYRRHVDYIHYNPVKHGYVDRPVDWPYSSIHRFIRQGIITSDWAANVDDDTNHFGERDR